MDGHSMITLYQGDCIEIMKIIRDCSIDSIVTDPPYELGFMGKAWDKSGISYDIEVWKESLRILKPGAYLLAFGGSRTYHRIACAIEDAGFEIRDQIQWVYGSGFPKSHKEENGQGTSLKPAHEPIVMARKPLSEKTVAENLKRWGTGALNIDACRISGEPTPINKLEKWSGFGQKKRPDYVQEINNSGRFPANFIHDGSDEIVRLFPVTSSGDLKTGHKRGDGTGNSFMGGGGVVQGNYGGDFGSAARFFYCAKASKSERDAGLEGMEEKPSGSDYCRNDDGSHGLESRLHGATIKGRNFHPTVKPTNLMRYLCRLITPQGGTVGDFFMGSGSTGRGAILEGFSFIGSDINPEYVEIATKRIHDAQQQLRIEFPVDIEVAP